MSTVLKDLSITKKLLILIMFLFIVYSIIFALVAKYNSETLSQSQVKQSFELLSDSIFITLRNSMNSVDPKYIAQTEEQIRTSIKGLDSLVVAKSKNTINLYSPNERFTKDGDILKAFKTKKPSQIETYIDNKHVLKYIKPMIAKTECLACHTNERVGNVIGVVSLTFSLEAQDDQLDNQTMTTMIIATIMLVIFLLIISFGVQVVLKPLNILKNYLEDFFDFLNNKKPQINEITQCNNDEIGEIIQRINNHVQFAQESINHDNDVLQETKNVIGKVAAGIFNESITGISTNPAIETLVKEVNMMIESTQKNLTILSDTLIAYGNSDFSVKAPVIDGLTGIVQSMLTGINVTGTTISEVLAIIDNSNKKLLYSSKELHESAIVLNNASNDQASSLEQTAAAIVEVTGTIKQSNKTANDMTTYAQNVTKASSEGEALAKETTNAMNEISEKVALINDAITVIDQIAFQTNILSLNAAVEAATAGEAGKGFAVVAGEVRNLATRSAEAAHEIKSLVENATNKANHGKSIADKMIEGYNGVNDNISQTISLIKEVENASKEQHAGITQINDSLTTLDKQTQQNAQIARETYDIAVQTDNIAKLVVQNADSKEFIGKETIKPKKVTTEPKSVQETKPTKTTPVKKEEKKVATIEERPKTVLKETKQDENWESF